MGKRRKSRGGFGKMLSAGYKMLSKLNTAGVIMSGDPVKIARHLSRKRTVKMGAKIIPSKR